MTPEETALQFQRRKGDIGYETVRFRAILRRSKGRKKRK